MENTEHNSREEERPVDFYYSSLEEQLQKELEDSEATLTPSKTEGRIILEIQEDLLSDFLDRLLVQEDRHQSNQTELMQKEICSLKAMLAEAKANCVPLSNIQSESLKEQLNTNTELLKAQCDLEQQTSNCMYLRMKLDKMKVQNEDLQANLEKMKAQNEDLQASLKENTQEKKELQATLEKVKVETEDLHASLKEIPRESLKKQLNVNTELLKAQCDLEQQTSNCTYLRMKLDKMKVQNEDLHSNFTKMEEDNMDLQGKLAEAKAQKEDLQVQLEQMKVEKEDLQVNLMKRELVQDYLKVKLQERKGQDYDLQVRFRKIKEEKEDLQLTLEKIKTEKEDLELSLEKSSLLKDFYERIHKTRQPELEELRAELKMISSALKDKEDLLESERLCWQEEKTSLLKTTETLKKDLQEHQRLLKAEHLSCQQKAIQIKDLETARGFCLGHLDEQKQKNKILVSAQEKAEQQLETQRTEWQEEKKSLLQVSETLGNALQERVLEAQKALEESQTSYQAKLEEHRAETKRVEDLLENERLSSEQKTSLLHDLEKSQVLHSAQLEELSQRNNTLVAALMKAEELLETQKVKWQEEKTFFSQVSQSLKNSLTEKESEWGEKERSMTCKLEDLETRLSQKKRERKWFRKLF